MDESPYKIRVRRATNQSDEEEIQTSCQNLVHFFQSLIITTKSTVEENRNNAELLEELAVSNTKYINNEIQKIPPNYLLEVRKCALKTFQKSDTLPKSDSFNYAEKLIDVRDSGQML